MSDYGSNLTKALWELLAWAVATSVLLAPLALWKLVEIITWLARHIHWS